MEIGKPKARTYQYDGNGNPLYYEESKSFRSMVWDEENRLRGINDNGKLHLYTYDHTGERVLKSSGESSTVVTNGLTSAVITHMDDYTAYVNPYFVVQKGRFAKHYFEGSSRIVSKLGEGTFHHPNRGIMAGGIDYIRQSAQMQEARDRYIKGSLTPPGPPTQHGIYASPEWTGQPYPSLGWQNIRQDQEPPEGWPRPPKFNEPGDVPGPPVQYGDPITPQTVKAGYGFIDNGIIEKNLYFYHPDHLGSSSYITDREGRITQHTEYIAFGEVLFEEHSTSKTMPYLFNGKELDTDIGLYYYGARYYDPRVSLWLNVDPLAEKYSHVSPYTYTLNNPINLIDPTGMEAEKNDPNGDEKNKNPRKAGTRPEGISEKESLSQIVTIDGKKYHKNTGNLFAEIGNKINSFFGGDDDYFVEHKPYDPVADGFIHEAVEQSAGTLIGGAILKTAGGVINKVIGASTVSIASKISTNGSMTTVGRWMSKAEYEIMSKTGRIVEGAGGQTFVATGGANSFTAATKGAVYAEFQVPTKSLLQGGKSNWFKVLGPNAKPNQIHMLNKQGGEVLPQIKNLTPILKIKK